MDSAEVPAIVDVHRDGEDLGIEESEFDKPTYLRRGLAHHDSNR